MKRYFGGQKVMPATVRQLAAVSFKDLVERNYNAPIGVAISREEYQALSDEERFSYKNGPYVIAVTMKEGMTHRCDENADTLVLVCLDIDRPAPGQVDYAKDFWESPAAVVDALAPYNCVIHTTASHTDAAPRIRIVVDVEANTKQHKAAVAYVLAMLGMPAKFKGARESKVLSQPFFFPVLYRGDETPPVIGSRTNGRAMQSEDIPERIVEEAERHYAYDGELGSDLAYLPLQDVEVEDIREPLFKITPDCDYKQWTEIASALRHQFRTEEQAQDAYLIFDEWSSQAGEKYRGEEDTYAKWKSFKPDAVGKNPKTLRTLFYHAQAAGWEPVKIATKLKVSFETWLAECEDANQLLDEGVRRISALPFKSATVEDMLLQTLQKRVRTITGKLPPMGSLKKDVSNARYRAKAEAEADNVPKWLRPWCFVGSLNVFKKVTTGEELVPGAFNRMFASELMPADQAEAKTGRPTVLPEDYALNVRQIRKVGGVIYDPRNGGAEPFFTYDGIEYLNAYRTASQPKEDASRSEEAGELFLKHLRVLIGREEYVRIIVQFLCFMVQNPGWLIRWMPVIQSAEGVGKTFLGKIIAAVIGGDNIGYISPAVLESGWNDWMVGKQFYVLEEVHIPGKNREAVANSLKTFISDERLTINKRNTTANSSYPNFSNAIAYTNFKDAFTLKDSNRRFMIIESPIQSKHQVLKLTASGHFEKTEALTGELGGALRHWMMNYDIPVDFPVNGPAPHTEFRDNVIAESKNRLQIDIEEMIADGVNPMVRADIISYQHLLNLLDRESTRNNHPASHYLQILDYYPYSSGQRFTVKGERTKVWVHRDCYDPIFGDPIEILESQDISLA